MGSLPATKLIRMASQRSERRWSLCDDALRIIDQALVSYRGRRIGTVAASHDDVEAIINYDQVFVRDGAVSGFVFLLTGRHQLVQDFLDLLCQLQYDGGIDDCFRPPQGAMPVSFKIEADERLVVDYGERSIARVSPVDSLFWWLILLRAYHRSGHDASFAQRDEIQAAIRASLDLMLTPQTTLYPVLFVPDGAFMIDRRLGVHGHPLEVQVLFHSALCAACELLDDADETNQAYCRRAGRRRDELRDFVNVHYWLDHDSVTRIHHYQVEGYGGEVQNPLNIQPEDLPRWVVPWLRHGRGYLAGNVGPGRLDCRFFSGGNLLAGPSGLISREREAAILDLLEAQWPTLIGQMPLKIAYPALYGRDWIIGTGRDPRNQAWAYQNGGGWPVLLWHLSAACVKGGRMDLLERALELAEDRLQVDDWPEYYDGEWSDLIGRRARRRQTWTAAGYFIARTLMDQPERAAVLGF